MRLGPSGDTSRVRVGSWCLGVSGSCGLGEKQRFEQGVSKGWIHQDGSSGKNRGLCVLSVDLEQEEAALRADLEVGGESGAEDG